MIPFSDSPPAIADPDSSSMFRGLNYHIQTAGVEHFKMWNVRQKLEAGGAIYIKDPESPSCHVIFVFSPLIDRHLYHPSGSAKPLETCRQESSWTFDDYCTHLGRKEGDKTKRSSFVVSATWVNYCIKEGRQCRDGRWALHEVIVRRNNPLQVKVGHSIPTSSKSGSPLTPTSLWTPSPRPSLDRLPFGDIFTTTTIKPPPPIIEKPKLLDPFTKAPPPAKTFHILECINQPNLEDSVILRGGLIESADLADYILVDQSDTNTPLGSLRLVGKQQVLSFQWLRDSIICGEIQDFAPYKIDLVAAGKDVETDMRDQSLDSSLTTTVKRRIRSNTLLHPSQSDIIQTPDPAQPIPAEILPRHDQESVKRIRRSDSWAPSQSSAPPTSNEVTQAAIGIETNNLLPSAGTSLTKPLTQSAKSGSKPALKGRSGETRSVGHPFDAREKEEHKKEIIQELDRWFRDGCPVSRTACLESLAKRKPSFDRATMYRRNREEISQALADMGHDVGIGGRLNNTFYQEQREKMRGLENSSLPPFLQRSIYLPLATRTSGQSGESHQGAVGVISHPVLPTQALHGDLISARGPAIEDAQDPESLWEQNMDIDTDSETEDPSFALEQDEDESETEDETRSGSSTAGSDAYVEGPSSLRKSRAMNKSELLSQIIRELDKWCRDGCPGYRTPYLKAIDRAKPGHSRVSFFKRHRSEILKGLAELGHDTGAGTKVHELDHQSLLAERRHIQRGGKSTRQFTHLKSKMFVSPETRARVSRTATKMTDDIDMTADTATYPLDLSEDDFDDGYVGYSASAKDGDYRPHQSTGGRTAKTNRLTRQIVEELDGWCKAGSPGSRTAFLGEVTKANPGSHRGAFFHLHRLTILQALSEMGHDVSPGSKLYGQSYQSDWAHRRHLEQEGSRIVDQAVSSAHKTAASHSSGSSQMTPTSGPSGSPSIPSTSAVPLPPPTPIIATSLILRNPTLLTGLNSPPISKALCDF